MLKRSRKVQVVSVRELWGSTGINVCQRHPFEWNTEAMDEEKFLGEMHLEANMRTKTPFPFSLTSQKKKQCPLQTTTHSTFSCRRP